MTHINGRACDIFMNKAAINLNSPQVQKKCQLIQVYPGKHSKQMKVKT